MLLHIFQKSGHNNSTVAIVSAKHCCYLPLSRQKWSYINKNFSTSQTSNPTKPIHSFRVWIKHTVSRNIHIGNADYKPSKSSKLAGWTVAPGYG